jgi:transcription factor 1
VQAQNFSLLRKLTARLVDDITKYIGPTLERHVGCDILDLNPGAGVWSRKLNDVLKPRSHILMEPDAQLYEPFLKPLLERPGTRLVPQSGILWKELHEAMNFLENQKDTPVDPSKDRERNDTLIVTANLCMFPKRRYRFFDSLSVLVLFQFISSIRSSTLFQKYGLIRMMLWVNDEDKRSLLPRCIQSRRKSAIDAEFACEWLAEVAGKDPATVHIERDQLKKPRLRDHSIDIQSSRDTLARMAKSNIEIPPHRMMAATTEALDSSNAGASGGAGAGTPTFMRPWIAELAALDEAFKAGEIAQGSDEYKARITKRAQMGHKEREVAKHLELLDELRQMAQLAKDPEQLAEKDAAYNEKIEAMSKMSKGEFRLMRDNAHIFAQDPPVMLWDRRPWEPLKAEPEEFFPSVDCALLDIQPKTVHRILRSVGKKGDRPSDILDLIQRSMADASVEGVSKGLDKLWPGAKEAILPHCPSLRDPASGGLPGTGHAEVTPRILNEKQWTEILEAFMKWPFRPTYAEMVGRVGDDLGGESSTAGTIDTGIS